MKIFIQKKLVLPILLLSTTVADAQSPVWQLCNTSGCGFFNHGFMESQSVLLSTGCISNDTGNTWFATGWGFGAFSFGKNSAGLFAGTDSAILYSTDNGSSWNQVFTSGPLNFVYGITERNDTVYAATRSGGIVMSPDNGASWSPISNGLPTDSTNCILATSAVLYVGLSGYGIYRSYDSGQNWVSSGVGLPANATVRSMADDGIILYASTDSGMFVSWDTGITWNLANYPGPHPVNLLAVDNVVLAGGNNSSLTGGLFRTLDHGLSWTLFSTGLNNQCPYVIGALYASPTHVFCGMTESMCVGGSTDIFRIDRGMITTGLPANAALPPASTQVFPNPFSDQINVLTLYDQLNQLRIFDMGGREVIQTLFTKSTTITVSQLLPGCYFYELIFSGSSRHRGLLVK